MTLGLVITLQLQSADQKCDLWKEKLNKLDFIKIKNCSVKGHVGRTRQDCKKTFKKDIWKRLSKLYEELLKLKKKETVWLKNGPPHLPLADASPNKTLDGE